MSEQHSKPRPQSILEDSNIQNHDRKAYSKTGILWEETILWLNHTVTLSITNNFNEFRFYSKSMQISVRTNIMPNTSSNNDPSPSFPDLF